MPPYPFLQAIFNNTDGALILLDCGGRVAAANPGVERLMGIHPVQVVGRTVEALLDEPALRFGEQLGFSPEALRALTTHICFGKVSEDYLDTLRGLIEIETPQPRCLCRTLTPVPDDWGGLGGLLMTFRDATPERSIMLGRERFYGMVVHDLRGPLTAINTGFKLLSEIASGDDPVSQAVSNTTAASQGAVTKLLSLVDSLLDVAKFQGEGVELCRAPVRLPEVVNAVIAETRLLSDDVEIDVVSTVPCTLPPLDIDGELVARLLLNLVDNALKFAPAQTTVSVGAHVINGMVYIDVRDGGQGIPDEDKARVFDLFSQTHTVTARRRGSGIGLAFCKLVVEAHGGRIWVEDNVPCGTVFVLTLPLYTPR
ncbi:sensor histidine kinase [Aggregatilinea lenta]|uniref:sensor histidine kinase n=1 Tax=Aggregatilinea lenta TaxID=913108 RepID=UPI000E5A5F20|nr:PAS domain-containing sensor histidine kinase [Aggregatilinea lenta]